MAHLFYLKTLLTVKSRELVHNYIYKFTILPYYNKKAPDRTGQRWKKQNIQSINEVSLCTAYFSHIAIFNQSVYLKLWKKFDFIKKSVQI